MSLKSHKWRVLVLGAEFDKVKVPLYKASARGKKTALLKTLLSSCCRMDCKYCAFRAGCRLYPREKWDIDELVRITLDLYNKGIIDGLFLSSSMYSDPDKVVEEEIEVAEELRRRGFKGYIHLRLMPGVSRDLIERAGIVADRIGVNIETVNPSSFNEISPSKGDWMQDVIKRLEWCVGTWRSLRRKYKSQKVGYLKAGIDTQLIVGVVDETDYEILKTTYYLYRSLSLKRIYFSAFVPIVSTPFENKKPTPLWREYRLYQVSELIRTYKFTLKDIESILTDEMLPNKDPKIVYAEVNRDIYPIDIETASFRELLKIPGIGFRSARKIIEIRSRKKLTIDDLIRILGYRRFKKAIQYMTLKHRTLKYS